MDSYHNLLQCKRFRQGFTLVEMLVVMGLIVLLAGLGAYVFRSDSTASLNAAQRSLVSVFQSAKSLAVLKGTDTRVIINFDVNDPDRYGRHMGIIYRDTDSSAGPNDWIAHNEGHWLPKSIFVVPSSGPGAQGRDDNKLSTQGTPLNNVPINMNIEFPRTTPQVGTDGSGPWMVYEFDSTGLSNNPGGQVVIAPGIMQPAATVTSVSYPNPFMISGIIIRRLGTVTGFNEYDDIRSTSD